MKFVLRVVSVLAATAGFIQFAPQAHSEVWLHATNVAYGSFSAVGSSADGHILIATGSRGTFTSWDCGVTWRTNSFPGSAASISATGSNIIVGASSPEAIHTSADAGLTWTTQTNNPTFGPFNNVRMIVTSADGLRLGLILYGNCPIFTSADAGVTWTTNNNSPVAYWTGIASSTDGTRLAAIGQSGTGVWISTNSGLAWSSAATFTAMSIASSADGSKLLAAGSNKIYLSSDSGVTWTAQDIQNMDGPAVASSADGTRLAATCYFGVYLSTNSGLTWTSANVPALAWNAVAASADGHRWIADSGAGSGLYIGSSQPTPELQITATNAGALLSWTIPSSPFALQGRSDLNSGNWSVVEGDPKLNVNTLHKELVIPATNSCSYFRLASP
jgi:hypothetical protein